jgi:hypothetical protein
MNDLPENQESGLGQTQELLLQSCWNETLGIATMRLVHDFNNLLTGILSLSDAFVAQAKADNPLHEGLILMNQNARRAAQIIDQISRLYREQPGSASYQNLNELVPAAAALLQKIIPRHTTLKTECGSESMPVYVDPVGFRKVVLAIALLLAEALQHSGQILLKSFAAGDSVSLEISASELDATSSVVGSFFKKHDGFALTRGTLVYDLAQNFARKNRGGLTRRLEDRRATVSLSLPKSDFTELERDLRKAAGDARG